MCSGREFEACDCEAASSVTDFRLRIPPPDVTVVDVVVTKKNSSIDLVLQKNVQ